MFESESRDIGFSDCLVEDIACPHSSSYLPHMSRSRAWRIPTVLLTSLLRLATVREQQSVGGRLGNHSSAPCGRMESDIFSVQERGSGQPLSTAVDLQFILHPRGYTTHTGTSLPEAFVSKFGTFRSCDVLRHLLSRSSPIALCTS